MSENYIVINGKKAELTQEQLEALGIEVKKPSPFDRVRNHENNTYYFIPSYGVVNSHEDKNDAYDTCKFECANYCTDKDLLQQQAYRETLNRLLWRFSMEHDGDKIGWTGNKVYGIYFCHVVDEWRIEPNDSYQTFGAVYFIDDKTAEQAIEEVVKPFMASHPDFKL